MGWEYNNYLAHHGVKGQKWGVRRYQNADGTLTAEGRKRYYTDDGNLTKEGRKALVGAINHYLIDDRKDYIKSFKPYKKNKEDVKEYERQLKNGKDLLNAVKKNPTMTRQEFEKTFADKLLNGRQDKKKASHIWDTLNEDDERYVFERRMESTRKFLTSAVALGTGIGAMVLANRSRAGRFLSSYSRTPMSILNRIRR